MEKFKLYKALQNCGVHRNFEVFVLGRAARWRTVSTRRSRRRMACVTFTWKRSSAPLSQLDYGRRSNSAVTTKKVSANHSLEWDRFYSALKIVWETDKMGRKRKMLLLVNHFSYLFWKRPKFYSIFVEIYQFWFRFTLYLPFGYLINRSKSHQRKDSLATNGLKRDISRRNVEKRQRKGRCQGTEVYW